jgi:hypothetical protein
MCVYADVRSFEELVKTNIGFKVAYASRRQLFPEGTFPWPSDITMAPTGQE